MEMRVRIPKSPAPFSHSVPPPCFIPLLPKPISPESLTEPSKKERESKIRNGLLKKYIIMYYFAGVTVQEQPVGCRRQFKERPRRCSSERENGY
jgi:hypothetical protein